MKIAIIGHGKMGRAVERIALQRGHEITAIVDIDNAADIDSQEFAASDVAIEFTTPATAVDNYRRIIAAGVPLVSGTTGWTQSLPEIRSLVETTPGASMLWTSNFSLGVNILFEMNRRLAKIMSRCPQYSPTIEEIHHIHKLDHPSGTAITLADQIIDNCPRYDGWTEDPDTAPDKIAITHQRIGETPGTHTIDWTSPTDRLSLRHEIISREALAFGAVLAAEWLKGRPGFHDLSGLMNEILRTD